MACTLRCGSISHIAMNFSILGKNSIMLSPFLPLKVGVLIIFKFLRASFSLSPIFGSISK